MGLASHFPPRLSPRLRGEHGALFRHIWGKFSNSSVADWLKKGLMSVLSPNLMSALSPNTTGRRCWTTWSGARTRRTSSRRWTSTCAR
eukprot:1563392-Pyramimonas_sp.AAC.1